MVIKSDIGLLEYAHVVCSIHNTHNLCFEKTWRKATIIFCLGIEVVIKSDIGLLEYAHVVYSVRGAPHNTLFVKCKVLVGMKLLIGEYDLNQWNDRKEYCKQHGLRRLVAGV